MKTFVKLDFCIKKDRNNTEEKVSSKLGSWLTFGQISPQKIIYDIYHRFIRKDNENLESFLNEFFIWRETAEHFVYHEENYDNIDGALEWARETLLGHKKDKRIMHYKQSNLENAETKDALWNAAQKEMVIKGSMHTNMRMYWGKTLLKWFDDPEEALCWAKEQTDKYCLVGNDPSACLAYMWAICGSMDRAFKERQILGKIRPMKTFKSPKYISRFEKYKLSK